jgi:hypothetical protein
VDKKGRYRKRIAKSQMKQNKRKIMKIIQSLSTSYPPEKTLIHRKTQVIHRGLG